MTFTMNALVRALADYLSPVLPGVTFYVNPNQQGTVTPAMFLRRTNARIAKKMGNRFLRTLGLDLVCLEDPNQVDMDDRYTRTAEIMDEVLETFPCGPAPLRTYERRWDVTDGVLHYKFDLKLWVSREEDAILMRSIQSYHEEVS